MISETKLDNSFPEGQSLIEGYSKPYRIDRNSHGGGIMHVRADIPSKLLSTDLLPMEGFYADINHQKKKWLLCCSYNPSKNAIKSHIEILHKDLVLYASKYENFIVLGDLNVGMDYSDMKVFCDMYDLKCLIKEPTSQQTFVGLQDVFKTCLEEFFNTSSGKQFFVFQDVFKAS